MSDRVESSRRFFRLSLRFYLTAVLPVNYFPFVRDGVSYSDVESLIEQIEHNLFLSFQFEPLLDDRILSFSPNNLGSLVSNKLPRSRLDLRSAIQTYLYNVVFPYRFPLIFEGKKYYNVIDLIKQIEKSIHRLL